MRTTETRRRVRTSHALQFMQIQPTRHPACHPFIYGVAFSFRRQQSNKLSLYMSCLDLAPTYLTWHQIPHRNLSYQVKSQFSTLRAALLNDNIMGLVTLDPWHLQVKGYKFLESEIPDRIEEFLMGVKSKARAVSKKTLSVSCNAHRVSLEDTGRTLYVNMHRPKLQCFFSYRFCYRCH